MNDPNSKIDIQLDTNKAVTTGGELPEDTPAYVLSKAHDDNTNGIVFNMKYIEAHNPKLAEEIRQAYEHAKDMSPNDELEGHEEDVALVDDMFQKLAKEARGPKKLD